MSTGLAIAATTAVLQNVLYTWMVRVKPSSVGDVTVTTLAPDRVTTGETEPSSLNLFLYQTTFNSGWRNVGLPAYDSQGQRTHNPPLAIDLHYLLTAYGKSEFAPEILLGLGMQLWHEVPILNRDRIRRVFTPPPTPGATLSAVLQALSTSGIAEQIEAIKITPHPLNTDEISKLWASFQVAYRPTAAYQISVILIESRQVVKESLPVREPKLYVMPLEQPALTRVEPQIATFAPNLRLTLHGQNLRSTGTIVQFGSSDRATPEPDSDTDSQLQVILPAALPAGVNIVQVVQPLMIGEPTPHDGFISNAIAFSLRPVVQSSPSVLNLQGSGNATRSGTLSIGLQPAVFKTQRVVLLLNEVNAPDDRSARAYRFNAPSRDRPEAPDRTNTILVPFQNVQAGNYLLRVRVDEVESLLDLDASNRPISPQVQIL